MNAMCIYVEGDKCPTCGKAWPDVAVLPVYRTCKPPSPPGHPPSLDCPHRGLSMRAVECATCGGGKKRMTVLACSVYGECSLAAIAGVRNCESCIRAGENTPKEG